MPLVEIAAVVVVGSHIGVLATIGLTIATSIVGAVLLRVQGLGAMTRIRTAMERGETPGRDLVHGLMIVAAGLLLIVPGFVTDAIGLLLFLPPVRDLAWRLVRNRVTIVGAAPSAGAYGPFRRRGDGRTIDLDADDYERQDGPDEPRPPISDGNRR